MKAATQTEFVGRDYRSLSFSQRWKARGLITPKFKRPLYLPKRNKALVVLRGEMPIGMVWWRGNKVFGLAAKPSREFLRQAGHSVGEELARALVQKTRDWVFHADVLTGPGRKFVSRLGRREGKPAGIEKRNRKIVVFSTSQARALKPHLKWRE